MASFVFLCVFVCQHLMCAGLWCLVEGDASCKTKLDPPLDGTECGADKVDTVSFTLYSWTQILRFLLTCPCKDWSFVCVCVFQWCRAGDCVSKTPIPQHVDGDWSPWGQWSMCSRTCGTGVQFRQRKCDNPPYVTCLSGCL